MNRDESLRLSHKIPKWPYILLGFGIVIIISGLVIWFITKQPSGTLPYPIAASEINQLGFNIYYPNQKLLPKGYSLSMVSFSTNNQALIYYVSYGNGQKLIFSDQLKPSTTAINSFYSTHMPLHINFSTPIGTATLGAVNEETVVSVPTNTDSWILITSPNDTNLDKLEQVARSLQIAKQTNLF